MKTIVIIAGHASVKDTIKRHWNFFKKSGCDLCGASSENRPDIWPEKIPLIDLGPEQGRGGDVLPRNFLKTVRGFLSQLDLQQYDSACLVEYDCVFTAPLPPFEGGFRSHLAGGCYPGLKASCFYHPIWQFDRPTALKVFQRGTEMVLDGDTEKGYTDFFLGRLDDLYKIGIRHTPGVYSRNTMESPADQKQCRELIKEGKIWFVHGIKTREQLEATIPPLP